MILSTWVQMPTAKREHGTVEFLLKILNTATSSSGDVSFQLKALCRRLDGIRALIAHSRRDSQIEVSGAALCGGLGCLSPAIHVHSIPVLS